jgi:hypothetical protein
MSNKKYVATQAISHYFLFIFSYSVSVGVVLVLACIYRPLAAFDHASSSSSSSSGGGCACI